MGHGIHQTSRCAQKKTGANTTVAAHAALVHRGGAATQLARPLRVKRPARVRPCQGQHRRHSHTMTSPTCSERLFSCGLCNTPKLTIAKAEGERLCFRGRLFQAEKKFLNAARLLLKLRARGPQRSNLFHQLPASRRLANPAELESLCNYLCGSNWKVCALMWTATLCPKKSSIGSNTFVFQVDSPKTVVHQGPVPVTTSPIPWSVRIATAPRQLKKLRRAAALASHASSGLLAADGSPDSESTVLAVESAVTKDSP